MLTFDLKGKRIWVAGHRGMVGASIVRRLASEDCEILAVSRGEVDLRRQKDVEDWVAANQPDAIFVAAARVGGILANDSLPADFIFDNLAIELALIGAAHKSNVQKLLFLGSTCVYPRDAAQPMSEDALLTGPLESTNEWYAVAKIAGIKMCQAFRRQYGRDYISVMPTNVYGLGDNYHPEYSHLPAALISRMHKAKASGRREVDIWGTGRPRREFIFSEDLADACVHLMKTYSAEGLINVGVGEDIAIADFARLVASVIGFDGALTYDASRKDGTPRKLVDVTRLSALGWRPKTTLSEGLAITYRDYLQCQWT